jgi:hypothetical protein
MGAGVAQRSLTAAAIVNAERFEYSDAGWILKGDFTNGFFECGLHFARLWFESKASKGSTQ